MKLLDKIIDKAHELQWMVNVDVNYCCFSKYSPCGQDFCVEISSIDPEEIIEGLRYRIEDFDCSYETYLWLDDTGHGCNGAPYDMKELYEDMEACLANMGELLEALEEIDDEEE